MIAIEESRAVNDVFAGMFAVVAAGLAVLMAVRGQTGGVVASLVVLSVITWAWWWRRRLPPNRIIVTADEIHYEQPARRRPPSVIIRRSDTVLLVRTVTGANRSVHRQLSSSTDDGVVIPLTAIGERPVREACTTLGWTFGEDPSAGAYLDGAVRLGKRWGERLDVRRAAQRSRGLSR